MLDEFFRTTEDMFIKALELVECDEIKKAKELLEDILKDDPDYGRAHGLLGAIYGFTIIDYKKAVYHLKIAMNYAPDYPHAYHNYAYLLQNMGEARRLEAHAKRSLQQNGIDKSLMYQKIAMAKEMNKKYPDALNNLKKAIEYSTEEYWTKTLKHEVKRIRKKMKLIPRFLTLL